MSSSTFNNAECANAGAEANPYLVDKEKGLRLLASLIAAPSEESGNRKLLNEIERALKVRFLGLCKLGSTPDEVSLYASLLSWFNHLEDVDSFPAIHSKNIVAVAGAFSAGKSRFMNTILGEKDLLPTGLTPSSAIPTYIHQGKADGMFLRNAFKNKCPVDRDAVQALSHDFERFYPNLRFLHVVKQLIIERTRFPFEHIAILDTPGYNSGKNGYDGIGTDCDVAMDEITKADHLIWVVDSQKGDIPADDASFLYDLDFKGEIFVVFNKADKNPSAMEKLIAGAKRTLEENQINVAGVCQFSSIDSSLNGDRSPVLQWLDTIDGRIKWSSLKKSLDESLRPFSVNHVSRVARLKAELEYSVKVLNRGAVLLEAENSASISNRIKELKSEIEDSNALSAQFEAFRKDLDDQLSSLLTSLDIKAGCDRKGTVDFSVKLGKNMAMSDLPVGLTVAFTIVDRTMLGWYLQGKTATGEKLEGCIMNERVRQHIQGDASEVLALGSLIEADVIDMDIGKNEVRFAALIGMEDNK